jgi:hypothetical protein
MSDPLPVCVLYHGNGSHPKGPSAAFHLSEEISGSDRFALKFKIPVVVEEKR